MPKTRFVVTFEVNIDNQGANVNEILSAVGQARDAAGIALTEAVIEWQQHWLRDRLCGQDRQAKKGLGHHEDKRRPGCRCGVRSFVKEGFRTAKRTLRTELGEIAFRVGYVRCRTCGRKFSPVLDVLGLASHQRRAGWLEREVVEATARTSFRRAAAEIRGLRGVPVSRSSSHRWAAGIKLPEVNPPPLQLLMADGTGYKKRPGRRGELRVAIGVTSDGRVVPLGTWSGCSWRKISAELKRRLPKKTRPALAVTDGEKGLDDHFASLAERAQRSRWHLLRDLRVLLWHDGLKKSQTDPFGKELAGIVAIEIPEEDWGSVPPLTREQLRQRVTEAEAKFQAMIDEFEEFGYRQGATYLARAKDRIFSRVNLWLETGIVAPSSTGVLEEIMRELGRRVKKLGWNWGDHGITQQASMILLRRYSQEQWEAYWQDRLGLRDRCSVKMTAIHQLN